MIKNIEGTTIEAKSENEQFELLEETKRKILEPMYIRKSKFVEWRIDVCRRMQKERKTNINYMQKI